MQPDVWQLLGAPCSSLGRGRVCELPVLASILKVMILASRMPGTFRISSFSIMSFKRFFCWPGYGETDPD